MTETAVLSRERRDLLQTLDKHRGFLRQTLDGMSVRPDPPEQHREPALRSAASSSTSRPPRRTWRDFIVTGAAPSRRCRRDAYEAEWRLPTSADRRITPAAYVAAAAEN